MGLTLLPPKQNVCQKCAVDHAPEMPHNQQSLHWQYWFYGQHGRWPTWADAMAHCDEATKEFWINALKRRGIDVDKKIDPLWWKRVSEKTNIQN